MPTINVRVKAVRARIDELQTKLEQMGDGDLSAGGTAEATASIPRFANCPLLGVTYAELYRANKIQETVYELLTQQCELAKVQEAKETPSVKVLDGANAARKEVFSAAIANHVPGCISGDDDRRRLGTRQGRVGQHRCRTSRENCSLTTPITTYQGRPGPYLRKRNARLQQVRDKILWFKRNAELTLLFAFAGPRLHEPWTFLLTNDRFISYRICNPTLQH